MDAEQFKKMVRAKVTYVAPLYGIHPRFLALECLRGHVPGATLLGRAWYVTPAGMEQLFEGKKKRRCV